MNHAAGVPERREVEIGTVDHAVLGEPERIAAERQIAGTQIVDRVGRRAAGVVEQRAGERARYRFTRPEQQVAREFVGRRCRAEQALQLIRRAGERRAQPRVEVVHPRRQVAAEEHRDRVVRFDLEMQPQREAEGRRQARDPREPVFLRADLLLDPRVEAAAIEIRPRAGVELFAAEQVVGHAEHQLTIGRRDRDAVARGTGRTIGLERLDVIGVASIQCAVAQRIQAFRALVKVLDELHRSPTMPGPSRLGRVLLGGDCSADDAAGTGDRRPPGSSFTQPAAGRVRVPLGQRRF